MANIVEQIISAGKTTIAANIVESGFAELDYYVDLTKNNFRTNHKRYGFVPKEAVGSEAGINRYYTLDHTFEVILTKRADTRTDDSSVISVLNDLYDEMDNIFQAFHLTKLGLSSIVMLIDGPSIDEPEYLEDNRLVVLRGSFIIKYRQAIN